MLGKWPASLWIHLSLLLLAVTGWSWALVQRFEANDSDTAAVPASAPKATQRHRRPEAASLSSVMTNPRTADLLARFDEILAEAQPGEPNQALIDACEAALIDRDFESRIRDLAFLIEALRPEDAPALHELFLKLHREEGRGFPLEYEVFARCWGQIDPEGALDYLAQEEPLRMPPQDVRNILNGWAERDPGAALQWLTEHPEQSGALPGVISGWFRYDQDAATTYLTSEQLGSRQVHECIRECANAILYDRGATSSVEWLASLPEESPYGDAASLAWNLTSFNYNELTSDKAAEVWQQVGNKPWITPEQFYRFTHSVGNARANPEGMQGVVESLSQTWPVEQAVQQFQRWSHEDPDLIQRWLAGAPETEWVAQIREAVPVPSPMPTE